MAMCDEGRGTKVYVDSQNCTQDQSMDVPGTETDSQGFT